MRDSPNRPNGIEPAGSRSRSIPVPFFSPGSPRILSFSRPFRTVSVPSRSIFLSPFDFSTHPLPISPFASVTLHLPGSGGEGEEAPSTLCSPFS